MDAKLGDLSRLTESPEYPITDSLSAVLIVMVDDVPVVAGLISVASNEKNVRTDGTCSPY